MAMVAPTVWRIEREESGVQFLERATTRGTGHFAAQNGAHTLLCRQESRSVSYAQSVFYPFGDLRRIGLPQVGNYHFDRMFAESCQFRKIRDRITLLVNEKMSVPFSSGPGCDFFMKSLSCLDHRRQ